MRTRLVAVVSVVFLNVGAAYASFDTTGPKGIDSRGLGLTGSNIGIGQFESARPGDPTAPGGAPFDTTPGLVNTLVDPAQVFYTSVDLFGTAGYSPTANEASEIERDAGGNLDMHSTPVASVRISTGLATGGVSPQAKLYSSGNEVRVLQDTLEVDSVTLQHIATRNGGDVRAINISSGYPSLSGEIGDGTNTISSFVDWSSSAHDVLYVVAGNQTGTEGMTLVDNFNGLTVAFSKKNSGDQVYREVDPDNVFQENPWYPLTQRTFTDLLAPGRSITVDNQGNTTSIENGTSFAAPHVVGTVALLQEHADAQIQGGVAGWNLNARRHEVMKAVLMNSADKVSGELGMTRTVLKTNGDSWYDTDAAFDELIPLDIEMGAGHLNARRALEQFSSGESDWLGTVPVIGWDWGNTTGLYDINKYVFDQELAAGSSIAVTVAWDREVTFDSDGGTPDEYDYGDTFNGYSEIDADDVINDLNLYLMPKGATDPYTEAIWESSQDYMPLEHLFVPIPSQGEYELWVLQQDADVSSYQEYAIAWWAEGVGSPISGDFDGNGTVDAADLAQWQGDFGVNGDSDADGDGDSDLADLMAWQRAFGTGGSSVAAVPEPGTGLLLALAAFVFVQRRER